MAKTFGSVLLAGSKRPFLPGKRRLDILHDIAAGPVPGPSKLPVLGWTGAAQVPFVVMDIAQLIDLSLTGVDERSVHVMPLEPAEVSAEAVAA